MQNVQLSVSSSCRAAEQLLADEHKAAAQAAAKNAMQLRQVAKKQLVCQQAAQAEGVQPLLQDASVKAELLPLHAVADWQQQQLMQDNTDHPVEQLQQQQPAGCAGRLQQQLPSNTAAALTEQGNRLQGPQPCARGTSDQRRSATGC